MVIVGIPETKRPGKERRAEETAFGRDSDIGKSIERFGGFVYIQKFSDFCRESSIWKISLQMATLIYRKTRHGM